MNTLELTRNEKALYQDHKAFIRKHAEDWIEVTRRLVEIRDNRLYRAEFRTFQGFCSVVLNISDRRARQNMQAFKEVHALVESGKAMPNGRPVATLENGTMVPSERRLRTMRQVNRPHIVPRAIQPSPEQEEPDKLRDLTPDQLCKHLHGISTKLLVANKEKQMTLMVKLVAEGLNILGHLQRVLNLQVRQ